MLYLAYKSDIPALKVVPPLYGKIPRSYFTFIEEPLEEGHFYLAKLNNSQRLYDIGIDELNLIDKLEIKADTSVTETLHEYIKGNGYWGSYNSRCILPNVVMCYYPVKVKYITNDKRVWEILRGCILNPNIAKSENNDISKKVRDVLAAGAMALGSMSMSHPQEEIKLPEVPAKIAMHPNDVQVEKPVYDKKRTLKAIKMVESNSGRNTNHSIVSHGLNKGSKAFGSYGLMPKTVLDVVGKSKNLKTKYGDALGLDDVKLTEYMKNKPGMEDDVANRYYDNVVREIGSEDPGYVGFAWLNGAGGAKKAMSEGKDLSQHWHVKKLNSAYQKLGEQEENRHQMHLNKRDVVMDVILKGMKS